MLYKYIKYQNIKLKFFLKYKSPVLWLGYFYSKNAEYPYSETGTEMCAWRCLKWHHLQQHTRKDLKSIWKSWIDITNPSMMALHRCSQHGKCFYERWTIPSHEVFFWSKGENCWYQASGPPHCHRLSWMQWLFSLLYAYIFPYAEISIFYPMGTHYFLK